ncbi:HEAT repeat domain-containing protein [bacterium]|nr:HEAT repeat domain-containing protein [bacterium]
MRQKCQAVLLIVFLPFSVFLSSSFAEEKSTIYVSLLPKSKMQSVAHILVQATSEIPKDWKMEWIVSIYNPKGYILPVGEVKDYWGSENRTFALKVPPGQYRVEIARRNDAWTMGKKGHFVIESGEWDPPTPELIAVAEMSIVLSKKEIAVLNITYQNPQVDSMKTDRGKTVISHICENLRLVRAKGAVRDVPPEEPQAYPLLKNASFADIGQSQLVASLKENGYSPAGAALLRASEPKVELIIQGLEDGTLELTGVVARILAKSGDRRSTEALIRTLKSGPQKSQHIAVWVLGELQDAAATQALVDALDHSSILLRNYACYALARVKDKQAVDELIKSLNDRSTLRVDFRFVVARPLFYEAHFVNIREGIIGESLPIPHLSVRRNAIYALGQIRDARALDPIIACLEDSQLHTRIAALYALGNFDSKKSYNALMSMVQAGQAERWLAVRMLGRTGDRKALQSLREIAKKDADEKVREAAEEAIKEILDSGR